MRSAAGTPAEYLASLSDERRVVVGRLRRVIKKNLPRGFVERMGYGMLAYVVPHELYPAGYHCDPTKPLPFINLASQKNHVSVYHMGLYDGPLLDWFQKGWRARVGGAPDLGKCCIRFKKLDRIPFELVGALAAKLSPKQWIEIYEKRTGGERKRR